MRGLPVDGAGLFSNQDLKQTIYDSGGCRIYFERGRKRQIVADAYQDREFALALMAFVQGYYENAKADTSP